MMLASTVWCSAVRCLLIVLLLEKGKGRNGRVMRRGWRGGGRQMSEIRGTPAAMSGCSIGCAGRGEKGKEREIGAELCLSDCAVLCSLV